VVRKHIAQKYEDFIDYQDFLQYGYQEFSIDPADDGSFKIEPNALHIWPRSQHMLIALPNPDKSFTATLFLPYTGEDSFEKIKQEGISTFFERVYSDALPYFTRLEEENRAHPVSPLGTRIASHWHYNHALLLGDAAHSIVPFYGQGMNAGFEDCTVLFNLLKLHKLSWTHIPALFSKMRLPNAKAIAQLALDNFIEMRDKVIDDRFQEKKTMSAYFHGLFKDRWVPLYTMVTFSHRPYADAYRLGQMQNSLLEEMVDLNLNPEEAAKHPSIINYITENNI
jgi:kynurenine 3-monooxygenase